MNFVIDVSLAGLLHLILLAVDTSYMAALVSANQLCCGLYVREGRYPQPYLNDFSVTHCDNSNLV